jgi:hypothetical protein
MHPGLGNYPTSLWQPGDIFCDEYRVPLTDSGLTEPTIGLVEIGFFDSDSQEPLPAFSGLDHPLGFFILEHIKIVPDELAPVPVPANVVDAVHFEQGIDLVGYTLSTDLVRPGEEFSLTVWWSAVGPLDRNYNIFAHLVNEDGEIIAQADGPPRAGNYPTNIWGNETIVDKRPFVLPDNIDPCPLTIRIGFYRLDNGIRLLRTGDSDTSDYGLLPAPVTQAQD